MRRLSVFGEQAARRLAAILGGSGIRAEVRPEPSGGLGVWVLDEDRLDAARDIMADFEANPSADRFDAAQSPPTPADRSVPATQVRSAASHDAGRSVWRRLPVTVGLIAISVVVAGLTELGEGHTP